MASRAWSSSWLVLLFVLAVIACFSRSISAVHGHKSLNSNASTLAGIELPDHMSFNAVSASASSGCGLSSSSEKPKDAEPSSSSFMQALTAEEDEEDEDGDDGEESGDIGGDRAASARVESEVPQHRETVKLHLKHRPRGGGRGAEPRESAEEFKMWDLSRIHTLHRRVTEKKNQNTIMRLKKDKAATTTQRRPLPAAASLRR